jgi:hypothetical protein
MRKIFLFFFISLFFSNLVFASDCTPEDDRYGSWVLGTNHTAQEAYDFGLKLQSLVRAKDIKGLFDLVPGELRSGPRKSFVKNKNFDEIFSKEWVKAVLSSKPDCRPVGWRGYMLAHGEIWFYPTGAGDFDILSINGKEEENLSTTGWTNNEILIHPSCFVQKWMSGDNFEEYAEQFNLNYNEFRKSPGKFFGSKIDNYKPIKDSSHDYSLIRPLSDCTPKDFKLKYSAKKSNFNEQPISVIVKDESYGFSTTKYYSTIQKFDINKCRKLAPNIGYECISSYLVKVVSGPGGSMGPQYSYNIYGLFDLPNLGLSIVPLKLFDDKNIALNYLDTWYIHLL